MRHSGIFNDGTCIGGWFWIHSLNFSLMTTANHFVNDSPNLNFLVLFLLHRSSPEVRVRLIHLGLMISTLEIALANIHRDVLVLFHAWDCSREHSPGCARTFGCGGCPSMQQRWLSFPFVCLVYDFLSFLFHCRLCIWTQPCLGEGSVVCASRFPEACVSERQISRVFWIIRNSRFPKFADQNHIRSSCFFLPSFTFESISCSPDFEGYLKNFVSQIRCAARRDNVLPFTFKEKLSEELSWDLLIGTNSCAKL